MSATPRRKFLLVHNAVAGVKGRTLVDEVVAHLEKFGASVTRCPPGEAAMRDAVRASSGHYDAIIAAGGDGTVRALAAALAGDATPIALIPMGTGNVLASEIGLSRRPAMLAELISNGRVQAITGATANGQPFYMMAGAGFDGAAVSGLDTPLKRRVGKLAYAGPGLRALTAMPPSLEAVIDGQAFKANWVVFANGQRYGGPFTITRQADLRQPGLQAVVMTAPTRLALMTIVAKLGVMPLDRVSGVKVLPCTRGSVRSLQPIPVQVDGDPFGVTPLDVEAGGAGFNLIVPQRYASSHR